jgi:ABC-2 type transport system permease protein
MSATSVPSHTQADGAAHLTESHPVTFRRVVTSEWVKFRSLRSSWAVLGGAVLGMVLIAVLIAYNTRHIAPNIQANDLAASSPLQGWYLGMYLIGALGVLFVTGEYGTGMIRSTLTAVPKRLPVLWAKLVVFVVVTAIAMIAASFVAFLAAEAFIAHYRHGFSLGDPGVLRVVIGTGVFLTLLGMFGAGLGWIIRSTAGALVTYFALLVALPVVFATFLGGWGKTVAEYFPIYAGGSFVQSFRESSTLAPWPGLLVVVLWVVVALTIAAVLLRRRDA